MPEKQSAKAFFGHISDGNHRVLSSYKSLLIDDRDLITVCPDIMSLGIKLAVG